MGLCNGGEMNEKDNSKACAWRAGVFVYRIWCEFTI